MTKTESAQVKGIALILMFWHHLFGGGSYLTLPENNWLPVISERLVLTIAGEDSACLFMFLFSCLLGVAFVIFICYVMYKFILDCLNYMLADHGSDNRISRSPRKFPSGVPSDEPVRRCSRR